MAKRGGWKTVLKYAAGILALSASVAAAWFLPGLYAGWQDARTEGRVMLSERENIQFLDTASLDIAGRLKMLEETTDLSWDWGVYGNYKGMKAPTEATIDRCRGVMEDWCEAGLFPNGCLAGITMENLTLSDTAVVYLDNAILQVFCFHFRETDGYAVTLVADTDMDMIYYASVSGPVMLDVIGEDLGFASFEAMAEYDLELLEEAGIAPITIEELRQNGSYESYEELQDIYAYIANRYDKEIRPADESRYDFAAVCGAQEMETSRQTGNLDLNADLIFESFTGHAYRSVIGAEYYMDIESSRGLGFSVMYGSYDWRSFVSDFAANYGGIEEAPEDMESWYELGIAYAIGDPEIVELLRYPSGEKTQDQSIEAAGESAAPDNYP